MTTLAALIASDPHALGLISEVEEVVIKDGTFSNAAALPTFTLDDIRAACDLLAAHPKVLSDITVAPDVYDALLAGATVTAEESLTAIQVHVDATLPAGAWHKGRPRWSPRTTGLAPTSPA